MDENLLVNGAFVGPFRDYQGIPGIVVAPGWEPWWISGTPHAESWKHQRPEYRPVSVDKAPQRVRVGNSSQVYATPWGTHVAGLYQQARVTPGSTVRFTCHGHAWSSEGDDPHLSRNPGNVRLRIGIDPQGGMDPLAGTVVWSRERAVYDHFEAFTVEAVARAPVVTVFAYSAPDWPKKHNEVYWDDANLVTANGAAAVVAKSALDEEIVKNEVEVKDRDEAKPTSAPVMLVEAPGRFVNRTVRVRVTAPDLEGVKLRVYGPYGEVQADYFGVEPGGRGQVWFWTFVPRKAGHYLARFGAQGVGALDNGIYIFEELDTPAGAEAERGRPRDQYERIYILLPQASEQSWAQAVVESGALDDGRHTLGFSADDAGIGDLDKRRVLVINPVRWDEPIEWWFAKHYPGVRVRTLSAPAPADLKIALETGMGQEEWD